MSEPNIFETILERGIGVAHGRQLFHLKTLYEASSALADPGTPADILKTFLPVTMGPLGLAFGFGVMLHSDALWVECMGLEPSAQHRYQTSGFELIHKFFPEDGPPPMSGKSMVMTGPHLALDPNLPLETSAVIAVTMGEDSHAVLGFGPKISEEPYSTEEIELLQGLASILAVTLKKGCAMECVHELNTALGKQNDRLQQALYVSKQAHDELTRHAFQLQALYETTLELADINDPDTMLDAFVLSLMGTLSYSCGWIALYGPGEDHIDVAYRGPDVSIRDRLQSPESKKAVLTRFVELKDRIPHANHSHLLENGDALKALPAPADTAVLFALDLGWQGVVGLSSPLSDAWLDEEKKRLLQSLVTTFMVTLGNARQVRMIRELNSELTARNVELQTTLDELTSAKHEIDVQTEAKERIVGLVHGEVDRVWRASWLDVALILLAGLVLGILYNISSPNGIEVIPQSLFAPETARVEVAEANRMAQAGKGIIIDARPADFYKMGHIPKAVNLPKDLFDFIYSMKLSTLETDMPLLVYGRTISRHYDADVARALETLGHEKVLLIDGGLDAWKDAGLEVAQ